MPVTAGVILQAGTFSLENLSCILVVQRIMSWKVSGPERAREEAIYDGYVSITLSHTFSNTMWVKIRQVCSKSSDFNIFLDPLNFNPKTHS